MTVKNDNLNCYPMYVFLIRFPYVKHEFPALILANLNVKKHNGQQHKSVWNTIIRNRQEAWYPMSHDSRSMVCRRWFQHPASFLRIIQRWLVVIEGGGGVGIVAYYRNGHSCIKVVFLENKCWRRVFFQRGLLLLISVWPWRLTRIYELPGVRTNNVTSVIRLFPVDDITQNRYFVIVQISSYYGVSRANNKPSLDFWIIYIYALQLLTTLPKIVVCSLCKRLCNISHTRFQNYII